LGLPEATLGAAISLAIGIGLQNFPEGFAVSMPLKQQGYSAKKSFFMASYLHQLNQLQVFPEHFLFS
jgi:zinc transporter ZupT